MWKGLLTIETSCFPSNLFIINSRGFIMQIYFVCLEIKLINKWMTKESIWQIVPLKRAMHVKKTKLKFFVRLSVNCKKFIKTVQPLCGLTTYITVSKKIKSIVRTQINNNISNKFLNYIISIFNLSGGPSL